MKTREFENSTKELHTLSVIIPWLCWGLAQPWITFLSSAWFQERGAGVETGGVAGRSFYTSLGHLNETWRVSKAVATLVDVVVIFLGLGRTFPLPRIRWNFLGPSRKYNSSVQFHCASRKSAGWWHRDLRRRSFVNHWQNDFHCDWSTASELFYIVRVLVFASHEWFGW